MDSHHEDGFASFFALIAVFLFMAIGTAGSTMYYVAASDYENMQESVMEMRLRLVVESALEKEAALLDADREKLANLKSTSYGEALSDGEMEGFPYAVYGVKKDDRHYLLECEAWRGKREGDGNSREDRGRRGFLHLSLGEDGRLHVDHWEMNHL